ncbi:MAG: hypothetical protein IKB13_05175, partial [Clostridia bacterium]|nr:hypothetical protein [Clostridia bacterium]
NCFAPFLRFFAAKGFRPLRRATKGSASRHRKLLKKFDQNFLMTDERHKLTRQTVICIKNTKRD